MRDWIKDIKEKTANMNKTATAMYVLTYYWYHILIFLAVFALIFIFIFHYATNKTAIFTCAMVNQQVDTKRDELWTKEFAKEIKDSQVIVDMIILKSFIFYSDEIKKYEKLINAYEDILLALTEIKNEKAAVLLDEFRIH